MRSLADRLGRQDVIEMACVATAATRLRPWRSAGQDGIRVVAGVDHNRLEGDGVPTR